MGRQAGQFGSHYWRRRRKLNTTVSTKEDEDVSKEAVKVRVSKSRIRALE